MLRFRGYIGKVGGIILLIVFAAGIVFINIPRGNTPPIPEKKEKESQNRIQNPPQYEPQFRKDGELTFFDPVSKKARNIISIEIVDNEATRTQGLMYRRYMAEQNGMLFIFEDETERTFWMKNTYLGLDIIYVNQNNQVVKIKANAHPLSEVGLRSEVPARYVIEVIAGFCAKFGIQEGDIVSF